LCLERLDLGVDKRHEVSLNSGGLEHVPLLTDSILMKSYNKFNSIVSI